VPASDTATPARLLGRNPTPGQSQTPVQHDQSNPHVNTLDARLAHFTGGQLTQSVSESTYWGNKCRGQLAGPLFA